MREMNKERRWGMMDIIATFIIEVIVAWFAVGFIAASQPALVVTVCAIISAGTLTVATIIAVLIWGLIAIGADE